MQPEKTRHAVCRTVIKLYPSLHLIYCELETDDIKNPPGSIIDASSLQIHMKLSDRGTQITLVTFAETSFKILPNVKCIIRPANRNFGIVYCVPVVPIDNGVASFLIYSKMGKLWDWY